MLGVILPDQSTMVNRIAAESPILQFLILVFILLANMTCMNMLIGILVGVVGVVAAVETEKTQVASIKNQLAKLLKEIDVDESGTVSKSEIHELLNCTTAA